MAVGADDFALGNLFEERCFAVSTLDHLRDRDMFGSVAMVKVHRTRRETSFAIRTGHVFDLVDKSCPFYSATNTILSKCLTAFKRFRVFLVPHPFSDQPFFSRHCHKYTLYQYTLLREL